MVAPELVRDPVLVSNHRSATDIHSRPIVEKQIIDEINNHRYKIVPDKPKIVSALGAIPKKGSTSMRLIHDCSRPAGSSLNDHACYEPFQFQSIQNAVCRFYQTHILYG